VKIIIIFIAVAIFYAGAAWATPASRADGGFQFGVNNLLNEIPQSSSTMLSHGTWDFDAVNAAIDGSWTTLPNSTYPISMNAAIADVVSLPLDNFYCSQSGVNGCTQNDNGDFRFALDRATAAENFFASIGGAGCIKLGPKTYVLQTPRSVYPASTVPDCIEGIAKRRSVLSFQGGGTALQVTLSYMPPWIPAAAGGTTPTLTPPYYNSGTRWANFTVLGNWNNAETPAIVTQNTVDELDVENVAVDYWNGPCAIFGQSVGGAIATIREFIHLELTCNVDGVAGQPDILITDPGTAGGDPPNDISGINIQDYGSAGSGVAITNPVNGGPLKYLSGQIRVELPTQAPSG
jgi:hypothetical protein